MARARNIKPSFFTNDVLASLDPIERLAFIGLWTIADYKGCLEYRPVRIKAMILPYDNCDFEKIAINLDKSGFIRMYSVQGIEYIKIVNFEKHQNPHKNEREKGSDIPDIDSQDIDNEKENNKSRKIAINLDKNGTTPADSFNLIPDSLNLIADTSTSDKVGTLSKFIEPTIFEIKSFMIEKGLSESQSANESIKFHSFYDSKNWMVGKTKMKKWKSAVTGWIARSGDFKNENSKRSDGEFIDNSAAGRVRAEVEKRRESRRHLADDGQHVRSQVGIELRGEG